MKVGIIGTGYVGLISSVCLAHVGHSVIAYDKNKTTITNLQHGKITIYEENLEELLKKTLENQSLQFTDDINLLSSCEIILIAVGTPPLPNGDADVSQVYEVIDTIIPLISTDTLLTLRSTIPIGTVSNIRKKLHTIHKKDQLLGFCPEFLREGSGIHDLLNPNILVFASDSEVGLDKLTQLYKPIVDLQNNSVEQIHTDNFETAELIKYTINSFLATKITFMNQIAQLAQKTNANMNKIIQALSADKRISKHFLNPGPGFGGSCFPKDTLAIVQSGLDYHVNLSLIREVSNANNKHKTYIASWIIKKLHQHKEKSTIDTIGIWGLTFKANTDDVRESASFNIIENLLKEEFVIYAHDPKGIKNFQHTLQHDNLHYYHNPLELLQHSHALIILTEWEEYQAITSTNVAQHFANTIVFDTRGICSSEIFKKANIELYKFGL